MAVQKNKKDEIEEEYRDEQKRYLQRLREELKEFNIKFGASMTELADGLAISRQKLYDFLKDEDEDLAINRSQILNLWKRLIEAEGIKLSEEEIRKREHLKSIGPNDLLMKVGFLPRDTKEVSYKEIEKPQVRRVISRLSGPWIKDDAVRALIIDNFLDQILEQGRPDERYDTVRFSGSNAENWIKDLYDGFEFSDLEMRSLEKYRKELRKLANSGKTQFSAAELYELYQSILEHETLNTDTAERIIVTDCQFRTLSIATDILTDSKEELLNVYKNAEIKLISFLTGSDTSNLLQELDQSQNLFTPVTEVTISCSFYIDQHWKRIDLHYASTATHIENMIVALEKGLNYPLETTGFFVRAIGRNSKSLARISVSLSENEKADQVYQGWWVTSNTIIGILNSIVDAFKKWIQAKSFDAARYYKRCFLLAQINENLIDSINLLFEKEPYGNGCRPSKVLLEEIKRMEPPGIKASNGGDESDTVEPIAAKTRMVDLMEIHESIIECDLKKATEKIHQAKELLEPGDIKQTDKHCHLLSAYAASCLMFYNFLIGDQEFLVGKLWRRDRLYTLDNVLSNLGEYVKHTGTIDFATYLCASQLYGTTACLEFYTNSTDELDTALQYFLTAAHYSARIGHIQRASYWLAYASRTYSRLNRLEQAKNLHDIAKQVLVRPQSRLSSKQISSEGWSINKDKDWAAVNIYIAVGEYYLKSEKFNDAIISFFQALNVSINTGSRRLLVDIIYNIHRTVKTVDHETIDSSQFDILSDYDECKEPENTEKRNLILKIATLIKQLLDKSASLEEVSASFKECAKEILDSWSVASDGSRQAGAKHPVAIQIDNNAFLA